jgi:hypothetical protein
MFYKPQSMNPEKHVDMPNEYPWIISSENIDGFIEISEPDFNILVASIDLTVYNNSMQYENNLRQQTEQREFGLYLIPELIDLMGERNLTLAQNGASINMLSIASDNASVKLLIETGALKTARSVCVQLKMKYPSHADIYDHVIEDISEFLVDRGFE